MSDNSSGITPPRHSFAGLPVCTRVGELEADIAIIGIHYVSAYPRLLTAAASSAAGSGRCPGLRQRVHPRP